MATSKTTRVKTFAAACKKLGLKTNGPGVTGLPLKHRRAIIAFYKLTIIIQALNDGWVPDYTDTDQYKYYIWTYIKADAKRKGGFGFGGTFYGWSDSRSAVGSRLCFKSRELAEWAWKQKEIKALYKDYMLMPS